MFSAPEALFGSLDEVVIIIIIITIIIIIIIIFPTYALQPSRLIVRSGLDVPTFATRRLHACHHTRAPSGGRWNCGRKSLGISPKCRFLRYI